MVKGDLDDPHSLDAALGGAYGVYSVQTFMGPDGIEGEERQGRAVAEAAARAKVEHSVYAARLGARSVTWVIAFSDSVSSPDRPGRRRNGRRSPSARKTSAARPSPGRTLSRDSALRRSPASRRAAGRSRSDARRDGGGGIVTRR
ncbi:NmrA family NAD(P)-binding protein [Nonomuraea sp. NEAU-A123]|nr:NmrA family NAD(P)-binding protein [Nonomuraea sp. NEAU-A123]